MTRAIPLIVLLFVAGRFAPAIHALIPHHDESSPHCDHDLPVHVDAQEDHDDHADCLLCTCTPSGLLSEPSPALFSPSLPASGSPDSGASPPPGSIRSLADSRAPPARPS